MINEGSLMLMNVPVQKLESEAEFILVLIQYSLEIYDEDLNYWTKKYGLDSERFDLSKPSRIFMGSQPKRISEFLYSLLSSKNIRIKGFISG